MKERVRQLVTMLVLISGVGELAASQIHILASTKLFATETGFYLFLFIIFGLTTGFNASLLKNMRGIIVLVGCGLLAIGSGIIYIRLVQADVADQAALTASDVSLNLMFILASVIVYAFGIVFVSNMRSVNLLAGCGLLVIWSNIIYMRLIHMRLIGYNAGVNFLFLLALIAIGVVGVGMLFMRRNGQDANLPVMGGLLAVWLGTLLTRIIGMRWVQAQVADQGALSSDDVGLSLSLALASIIIYAAGTVLIPILSWGDLEESTLA